MTAKPSLQQLSECLSAAGAAHHDYETNFLEGKPDEHWAGWYAAYTLGRLGDFTRPTLLTERLLEAPGEGEWSTSAATHVLSRL